MGSPIIGSYSRDEAKLKLDHVRTYLVRERFTAAKSDQWDVYEAYTEALYLIYLLNNPFTDLD